MVILDVVFCGFVSAVLIITPTFILLVCFLCHTCFCLCLRCLNMLFLFLFLFYAYLSHSFDISLCCVLLRCFCVLFVLLAIEALLEKKLPSY